MVERMPLLCFLAICVVGGVSGCKVENELQISRMVCRFDFEAKRTTRRLELIIASASRLKEDYKKEQSWKAAESDYRNAVKDGLFATRILIRDKYDVVGIENLVRIDRNIERLLELQGMIRAHLEEIERRTQESSEYMENGYDRILCFKLDKESVDSDELECKKSISNIIKSIYCDDYRRRNEEILGKALEVRADIQETRKTIMQIIPESSKGCDIIAMDGLLHESGTDFRSSEIDR